MDLGLGHAVEGHREVDPLDELQAELLLLYLAAALLLGLLGNALFGAWWLDPAVGLLIAAVAVKEGLEAWRGEGCACVSSPLPLQADEDACHDDDCCKD